MEKNNNKSTTITIVILIILVIGLTSYIAYDKLLTTNKNKENTYTNNKSETLDANLNKVINFEKENCINSNLSDNNYEITRFGNSEAIHGLTLSISNDEKTVNVQARYDIMFPNKYTEEEILSGTVKNYESLDLKFDKNVEFIFGGRFAADNVQGTVFIFLLEDGSLEYMKYSDIYNSQKFEHHPINSIKDIIKFDNIAINKKDNVGTSYTAIAYKIDGTYYDLSEFIKVN